ARGPLWRLLHAKRWHYASIAGPRVVAALAVVDVGYAANAFMYLFDRENRTLVADLSFLGLPWLMARVSGSAVEGARTSWSGGGARVLLERGADFWRLWARAHGDFEIDATFDDGPMPTL